VGARELQVCMQRSVVCFADKRTVEGGPHAIDSRLEVIRGGAALAVTLFHVRSELWVGWKAIQANPWGVFTFDAALAWVGVPMHFMGAGVLLFFVISGYCIHRPQAERQLKKAESGNRWAKGGGDGSMGLRDCRTAEDQMAGKGQLKADGVELKAEMEMPEGSAFECSAFPVSVFFNSPSWFRFFVRRFLRIAPPYWVALVLSAGVWAVIGDISAEGWQRIGSSALMVQNYWGLGGQVSTNPSLWSLPVELELYLVYPLAWWIGNRVGWTWMLLLAVAVSASAQYASLRGAGWLDGSFPKFWALWCAGAWVAEQNALDRLPQWNLGWGAALLVTAAFAVGTELVAPLQPLTPWAWGVVGLLALLWAVAPCGAGPIVSRMPTAWLAWIGRFSYSLYLIHYPLFQGAGYLWRQHFGDKPHSLLVALVAVVAVVPLAWLFHRLIELPSHRLARRWGRERSVVRSR
jgi:peptidoglycan/LPS O-acetylase OafA/YrhL